MSGYIPFDPAYHNDILRSLQSPYGNTVSQRSARSLVSVRRTGSDPQNPDHDHCSPPPPYSRHDTASTTNGTASISTTAASTIRSSSHDPIVERLRRFLSFCIAVDYDAHLLTPDTLDKVTWCHFMSLFLMSHELLIRRSRPTHSTKASQTWPSHLTHAQLEKHIFRPARKLGVPKDTAMAMLRNFAQQSHVGGYRSNLDDWANMWDLAGLESKLRIDRDWIFDTVLPPTDNTALRTAIDKKYRQVAAKWFVSLYPAPAKPTRRGKDKLGWEGYRDWAQQFPRHAEDPPPDHRLRMNTLSRVAARRNLYVRLLQHPGRTLCNLGP
ncbi:hypothetical protein CLAFUW4_12970 [Fulvia fulva]|uniref:Uncharacterized protein n=1 Tax=Passalora fulva TaxID=5499 RepID=A0A9Q8PJV9_PASFU|nr:uncharacterized protein CLAFUR5_12833 [Fulvia fulva]KAK4612128.1 hypothetical protein CLAFUR4_12974 [Fulvia fulva]KAK4612814.1 hypothetical protein CLAFUR0_12979 [Fulvia fulva]UJO23762.1 hypothetical protein CLAFUR5_12833 [Fulvia fulva]WPV21141.1 hypothetical protein CLAFUW4_12970 [Fulvia fulva]WPV36339.1 hypothetical protein CLAFUW7_12977 [Fulvia fulva]